METFLNYRYQRPELPPIIWEEGSTQLRDYGGEENAQPLVFLPSLINKSYIFDLLPECSMIRYFRQPGFHPYLIEWANPQAEEYGFTLADYSARIGRMLAALDKPVTLIGYCLGGLLAMQVALLFPERVKKLVLLATPWDFRGSVIPLSPPQQLLLGNMLAQWPVVPKEWIHAVFFQLQPHLIYDKFARLATLPIQSEEQERLLAIEHWVQDGINMTRPVAEETFIGFGQCNNTLDGRWINPAKLSCPALVLGGLYDRLAPASACAPLAGLIPEASLLTVDTGHTGLAAGAKAQEAVWRPIKEWLRCNTLG